GIAHENAPDRRRTCNEILQRSTADTVCWIDAKRTTTLEPDAAFAVTITDVIGAAVAELAAKLDGVAAMVEGDIVGKLIGLVRRGQKRPAMVTTKRRESGDRDLGHAEIDRRRNSGIDSVSRGIHPGVDGQNGLIETIKAELKLVNPARTDGESRVRTQHLGTGHRPRLPERLENRD